jgi:hypothetical protein
MCYNYWPDYRAPSDTIYKVNKNKCFKADYSCLNFNKFVVFRVSFADEKSQKSPQVKDFERRSFFLGGR